MRFYAATLFVGLFSLQSKALAAVDCNGNVTISNADDAREVAETCRMIGGKLDLSDDLAEDVNIEKLEEIKGGLTLNGTCGGGCSNSEKGRFNISMPDLTAVGGPLIINDAPSLVSLSLPKLETIRGLLHIENPTVTLVDITNLKFVESLSFNMPNLKSLLISGLEGPHNESGVNFDVKLTNVGQIKSVDGIFKNPIDPFRTNKTNYDQKLTLDGRALPHVKNLTFGWKFISRIELSDPDFTLTLGGPRSKDVYIGRLSLTSGNMKRSETLKQLRMGYFDLFSSDKEELHLDLDSLGQLRVIRNDRLQSITNSPAAERWENFTLNINQDHIPLLAAKPEDSGDKTWHWPKSVEHISLEGNVSSELVMEILDKTNITESFGIYNRDAGALDCNAIGEEMWDSKIFPNEFRCDSARERSSWKDRDEGGASSLRGVSLVMQLTLAGLIASVLCF